MNPTPRLTHRAAQAGLVTGLAVATASVLLPGGTSAAATATTPKPGVSVQAQTVSKPVTVPRAGRSRALAPKHLPTKRVTKTVAVGSTFSGQASWYGGYFQGRRTANGERFDTNDLTAASKTLPFGTRLRVCHDGCVVVRINDRGPYVGGRILDLSRAASTAIGFSGVAHVTATPVAQREVSVVDTAALARQRAHERHAALVRRSHQLRAAQLARAAAAARPAAPVEAADSSPLQEQRVPMGVAGGLLSSASAGLLGLGSRKSRRRP